ncbi:MAG: hypothetical protein ACKVP7_18210 [Hyphomicrobiaceae bacterium]
MVARTAVQRHLRISCLAYFSSLVALALTWTGAMAQQDGAKQDAPPPPNAIIRRGDAVINGFSGTLPPGADLPADVHPLDRTYLDPDGITARIFDLTQLGGGPAGQLADAPVRLSLKARQIGHVFGIAFDGDGTNLQPNIYLAASSVYGLQIVMPKEGGGYPERVMTGRPGAQWMPGLFGDKNGLGSPGTIWKVDGRTGAVSRFAEIKTGEQENSGAGLGNLAFDPRSRHLYVSDMETGLIWRLALDGRTLDAFDHGTQGRVAAGMTMVAYNPDARIDRTSPAFNTDSPDTWGFAEPERRVWGLAVENDRLYYSVADGPKIWSVSLKPDGSFGDDARLEIDVTGTPGGNMISSIMFDGGGLMYLSQRGTHLGNYDYAAFSRPQEAMVMRYRWSETEGRWAAAHEEYAIGLKHEHRSTMGGIALNYGYDRFGNIDYGRCRETLWTTGEHLREGSDIVRVTNGGPRLVHGLQGNYKSRVRPDNEPPFESWFLDYDARFDDVEHFGHIGNVGIFGPCERGVTTLASETQIPVWTKGPNVVIEKRCYSGLLGGRVRCEIILRNKGDAVAGDVIHIVDTTKILWGPDVGKVIPVATATPDGPEWVCEATKDGDYACSLPGDLLAAGAERRLEVWVDTKSLIETGNVGFRNCVTLRHPHGRGKACSEGGAEIVVKKTAPLECQAGFGCKFTITITNAGATAFEGDVLLADSMFQNGQPASFGIASIAPALGCSNEPTQLPFACAVRVALGPGESRTHVITVQMPAPGGYWMQNCFGVAEPWVGANAGLLNKLLKPVKYQSGSAPPGGYPSCVWVKVPSPEQKAPTKGPGVYIPSYGNASMLVPPAYAPPEYTCSDGRPPLASGRCPCPLYAPYNPETGRCGYRQVCWDKARLRSDGTCCPWGTVYWYGSGECRPPPHAGCHDIWRRANDGSCCPYGTRAINGICRQVVVERPCAWNEFRNNYGICIKLPIFIPLPIPAKTDFCLDGRPRPYNGVCPSTQCPPGRQYVQRTGHCELPHTTPPNNTPRPCPINFVRNTKGECLPPIGQQQPCAEGTVRNILGKCAPPSNTGINPCPVGTRRDGTRCVAQTVPPIVTIPGKPGAVTTIPGGPCPEKGFLRDPKGNCVPPRIDAKGPPQVPPLVPPKGPANTPLRDCPSPLVRDGYGACVPAKLSTSPPIVVPPKDTKLPVPGTKQTPASQTPPGSITQPTTCTGRLVRDPKTGNCVLPSSTGGQQQQQQQPAKVETPPPKVITPPPKVVTPPPKVITPPPKVVTPPPKVVTPPPKVITTTKPPPQQKPQPPKVQQRPQQSSRPPPQLQKTQVKKAVPQPVKKPVPEAKKTN